MAEGGLDEWQSWRCCRDDKKFCPPEGCPKSYGCARERGWTKGMPTPNGCIGLPDQQEARIR
jgi:hypothetical protein